MSIFYNDYDSAAKRIIEHVGKTIVIGIPLGLGKPIGLVNALYRLASADKSIDLTILTALTLAKPTLNNDLEKRFVQPILERVLGDYENPLYEATRERQQLPSNIKVIEFYLAPGNYLNNHKVQQDYISTNYTHAVQDAINHSINVYAQLVSQSPQYPNELSLSCNTDLFHETTKHLKEMEGQGKKIAIIAEVNCNLPFMLGDAVVKNDIFTDIVDTKQYRSLFATPKPKISIQDHLIGLYTSALVKDGGCLQIGIGKLGEAITHALIFRHTENALYQNALNKLQLQNKFGELVTQFGSTTPFQEGLYASTEMLSDGYAHLYNANILKKRVYDHVGLQRLLNLKIIGEKITHHFLDVLLENKIIHSLLTAEDIVFLKHFGIFKSDIIYQDGNLILSSGEVIPGNLIQTDSKKQIISNCLGDQLKTGKIVHAAFFLGSRDFYHFLKTLPNTAAHTFDMTSVARTNRLCWSHELSLLQRQDARFINASMMVTLAGTVVSDGLVNWQEVSGVGGQFDFADMAQNLPQSRFIINCHSTRTVKGKVQSNIVWNYPNMTLSRTFRDIVITEYGIADCRSKTDSEIIKAILNITDSRFQEQLLKTAKKYGKIESDYQIPDQFKNNHMDALKPIIHELQVKGFCKPYPFGSDLTEDEQVIESALLFLSNSSKLKLMFMLMRALITFQSDTSDALYLKQLALNKPRTIKEFIYKKLLTFVISRGKI